MKKITILLMTLLLVVVVSGCDTVNNIINGEFNYDVLENAVVDPSGSQATKLDGREVEFTAYLASNDEVMESEETDINGKKYAVVYIQRNMDHAILVQIEGLKDIPEVGSIVDIKGKVDGYIYGTDQGERIEELHVLASSVKVHKETKVDVNKTDTVKIDHGELKFTKGKYVDNDGQTNLVVYAEAKNSDATVFSPMSQIYVYQGDTFLSPVMTTSSYLDKVDANVLDGSGIVDISKGEKSIIFVAYEGMSDTTTPITIEMYNDQFDLVYEYTLPIE